MRPLSAPVVAADREWDNGNAALGQMPDGTIATLYYAAGTASSPEVQAIAVRYTEEELLKP